LRISGIRRLVGDDAEVNVDTGLGAAESCRPLRQARSERRHRRDEASGQPDPRRGEIDGPAGSGGAIVEKLDQVEQPALGVDDETDYDDGVFDPGDYGDVDDAM
jgi:hypothetical protein